MIVTEEEARKLWCPMARCDVGGEGVAAVNRRPTRQGSEGETAKNLNVRCLASGCMAWCPSHTAGKGSCGLARL